MLAIGSICEVLAIAFWTSTGLADSSWVGLTRQTTSTSLLVSFDLCIPIVACSYLGSWT